MYTMHALFVYIYIHVHYALNLHVNTHLNMRLCRVIASYLAHVTPPRHNGIVFTRYFSPVFVFLLICSEFLNSKMNVNLMWLNLVL